MHILLIEDERDISRLINIILTKAGYAVDLAADGERGSFLARTNDYDLVITDYVMPKLDGFNVIKEIRQDNINVPILMLSVRQSIQDKVDVLKIGADDYLAKPFAADELLARVQALMRRPTTLKLGPLIFRDLTLDPQLFRVKRGNKEIRLTNKEFSLLHYLIINAGRVIPRDTLLEHVWGGEIDPFSNTLETHILRLRRKIETGSSKLIHNIAGRGYTLDRR